MTDKFEPWRADVRDSARVVKKIPSEILGRLILHRGFCAHEPKPKKRRGRKRRVGPDEQAETEARLRLRPTENSILAIEAGFRLGFKHVELDVHATKDGHAVVSHDLTFQRVADGSRPDLESMKINEMSLAQVQKIRLRDGSTPPTLAKVLAIAKRLGGRLHVELKEETGKALVPAVAGVFLDDPSLLQFVGAITSFGPGFLSDLKKTLSSDLAEVELPHFVLHLALVPQKSLGSMKRWTKKNRFELRLFPANNPGEASEKLKKYSLDTLGLRHDLLGCGNARGLLNETAVHRSCVQEFAKSHKGSVLWGLKDRDRLEYVKLMLEKGFSFVATDLPPTFLDPLRPGDQNALDKKGKKDESPTKREKPGSHTARLSASKKSFNLAIFVLSAFLMARLAKAGKKA